MGVFDRKLYGVWNNSSIIKEMIEVAIASIKAVVSDIDKDSSEKNE